MLLPGAGAGNRTPISSLENSHTNRCTTPAGTTDTSIPDNPSLTPEVDDILCDMTTHREPITITYTNWKGETADRIIEPIELWHGATEWHPQEQWFLKALDTAKSEERDFALRDVVAWDPGVEPERSNYSNGAIQVRDWTFAGAAFNVAEITLDARYPESGFALNSMCTAIINVHAGAGKLLRPGHDTQSLVSGEQIVLDSNEPYAFEPSDNGLVIHYISTPPWNPEQARSIE